MAVGTRSLGGVLMAVALVACGSDEKKPDGRMTVQGSVAQSIAVDNARAIAIGRDGRTFWTYLDAHRDFTLKLPVGQSYRILIANQLASGGQKTVARVVLDGADGKTVWVGANDAVTVDFGRLRVVSNTRTGLTTRCAACDGDGADDDDDEDDDDDAEADGADSSDHSDDNACREDGKDGAEPGGDGDSEEDDDGEERGEDEDCHVCTSGKPKEVQPSTKPGSECAERDSDKTASKTKYDDEKPCTEPAGGESSNDDAAPDGGGNEEGASCVVTSQCVTTCTCVASACTPDAPASTGGGLN